MRETKSIKKVTKQNFSFLEKLTQLATSETPKQDSDNTWFKDEEGRQIVYLKKHRKEIELDQRERALEMHGNNPNRRLDLAGFPIRDRVFMLTYDYSEAHPKVDFSKLPFDWLYFLGFNGNGKTTLACRLAWEWMKDDPLRESTFLSVSDWIRNLKVREDQDQVIELPKLKQFVILDDFDKLYYTDWQASQIFRLIDHLYRKDTKVIITGNRGLDEIIENSNYNVDMASAVDRIKGRVGSNGILFKGKSYRGQK